MDLLSATLTLILIMDPLGNIPMFLSILNKIPDENRRRKILIRELLLALLVLLVFLFLGRHLLQWLNLQPQSLRIGGGIVLFLIAIKMIFPPPSGGIMGQFPEGEPLLVPLAVPLLAGPLHFGNADPAQQQCARKMDELASCSDTGLVADKRRYDLFRKSPETLGRKRTGRRRTVDGDGTCHPFSADVARRIQ